MKPIRVILGGFGCLFLLALLLPLLASPTSIGAMLKTLPFGWWHFLTRNIPQLSLDWGLITTGVICTAGVLLLGNWLMGTLYRQFQQTQSGSKPIRKWGWSS